MNYVVTNYFNSNQGIESQNTRENRMSIFNSIYDDCNKKLYLNENSYTINRQRVEEFKNANPKQLEPLLNFIFGNLIHISFDVFKQNFEEYFLSVINHKKKTFDGIIQIIIIVPGLQLKKSNFWLALIIKDIMVRENLNDVLIIDIQPSINDAFELYKGKEYIYLIPDDCSYSGTQVSHDLCINKNNLEDIITNNVNVYPIIPFISNHAYKTKFKETFNKFYKSEQTPIYLIFLEDKITFFNSFWDLCIEQHFNPIQNDVYFLEKQQSNEYKVRSYILHYLWISEGTCLIYFDHKIADAVSTIQQFLVYPKIFSNNLHKLKNPIKHIDYHNNSFYSRYYRTVNNLPSVEHNEELISSINENHYWIIDNCNNLEIFEYQYVEDLNENEKACPKTFYKNIEFKVDNKTFSVRGAHGMTLYDAMQPTETQPTKIQPTGIQPTEIKPTGIQPTEILPNLFGGKYREAKRAYLIAKNRFNQAR
jgi:hypothetical protein